MIVFRCSSPGCRNIVEFSDSDLFGNGPGGLVLWEYGLKTLARKAGMDRYSNEFDMPALLCDQCIAKRRELCEQAQKSAFESGRSQYLACVGVARKGVAE